MLKRGAGAHEEVQSLMAVTVKTEVDEAARADAFVEIEVNMNCFKEELGLVHFLKTDPGLSALVMEAVVEDGVQASLTAAIVGDTNVAAISLAKQESPAGPDPVLCGKPKKEIIADESRVPWPLYICAYCQKTYHKKYTLKVHIESVHGNISQRCHECEKNFTCRLYLQKHIKMVHANEKHECELCKKVFRSKQYLNHHIKYVVHNKKSAALFSVAQHKCDFCQKTFNLKTTLMIHKEQVHATSSHTCVDCKKEFKCEPYLLDHIKKVHSTGKHECEICKKVFRAKQYLNNHIRSVHRKKSAGSHSQFYQCDQCMKTYNSKLSLKIHYKCIHAAESHKCTQCGAVFKCKAYLVSHIKNVHSKQQYECAVCKTKCKSEETLRDHIGRFHGHRCAERQQAIFSDSIKNFQSKWSGHQNENRGTCSHSTADSVSAVAGTSTEPQSVVVVKEESAVGEVELGPVMFQHMDRNYRPHKEEQQND